MKWHPGTKKPKKEEHYLRDYRDDPCEELHCTPFRVDLFVDGLWMDQEYELEQAATIVTPSKWQDLPWTKIKEYEE
jgi:hypothetical protein